MKVKNKIKLMDEFRINEFLFLDFLNTQSEWLMEELYEKWLDIAEYYMKSPTTKLGEAICKTGLIKFEDQYEYLMNLDEADFLVENMDREQC